MAGMRRCQGAACTRHSTLRPHSQKRRSTGVSSSASACPGLAKQPAWPAARAAGIWRARDGASLACHRCAETPDWGQARQLGWATRAAPSCRWHRPCKILEQLTWDCSSK